MKINELAECGTKNENPQETSRTRQNVKGVANLLPCDTHFGFCPTLNVTRPSWRLSAGWKPTLHLILAVSGVC